MGVLRWVCYWLLWVLRVPLGYLDRGGSWSTPPSPALKHAGAEGGRGKRYVFPRVAPSAGVWGLAPTLPKVADLRRIAGSVLADSSVAVSLVIGRRTWPRSMVALDDGLVSSLAMSEDFVAVVRLNSVDAASEARRVLDLLLGESIIAVNTSRDDLHSPSELAVGPRALEALEDPAGPTDWLTFSNNGVEIESGWAAYIAMENEEPSACPACGVVLSEEAYADLISSWGESQVEPEAGCGSCGSLALLGDWSNEWPSVFGFPAVTFNNWPPLASAFLEGLRRELGGRTIIVRAHY